MHDPEFSDGSKVFPCRSLLLSPSEKIADSEEKTSNLELDVTFHKERAERFQAENASLKSVLGQANQWIDDNVPIQGERVAGFRSILSTVEKPVLIHNGVLFRSADGAWWTDDPEEHRTTAIDCVLVYLPRKGE